MAEVLSQSEIDALLSAVSSGSVDTAEADAPTGQSDWIAYDLTSQEKIFRGRFVGLEGIHDRFARNLRVSLTNFLKKNVSVSCTNTDFLKFGDYLTNVLLPASLNVLHLPDLQGNMIFMMTSKLTYALVDSYYGGSERPFAKLGGRAEFTAIENKMIHKICMLAVTELKEAWRLNYPLQVDYARMESNPAFVGSIHASELVAVVSFEVEFENLSGPFNLIIQVRALDPIHQQLSVNVTGELRGESETWSEHWMRELSELSLDMRVELGETQRTLHEIQTWKAGDVIGLSQDAVAPLSIFIENIPKLKGTMGAYRGNTAVRLVGIPNGPRTNSSDEEAFSSGTSGRNPGKGE